MKKNKAISIIAIMLAVLMLLSLFISAIPVRAHADELDELKAKKEELSAKVQSIKEKLDGLEEEKTTVLERKAALEEQNDLASQQLEIINIEIENYNDLIETKAQEVDAAKNREQRQLEKYRSRIRAMEENGGYNILALILESESFAQLLTAIDDMGEIMQSDKQLQKQYEDAREETEEIKAQFEAEKAVYEADQAELRKEQEGIQADMDAAAEELERLEEEIEEAVRAYEAAEQEEANAAAAVANAIAANNARKAQERAAAQAAAAQAAAEAKQRVQEMTQANADATAAGQEVPYTEAEIQAVAEEGNVGYVSGGGSEGYIWPLPCSTRVTSRFGNRADPFTGQTRYHSGIDIDGFGNDGSPVVAAASGTVITASYDSAYGNYTVSQGQTVGYVGSTGRATGTHLHFEVYVGDGRVDPAQYFSGISYYQC